MKRVLLMLVASCGTPNVSDQAFKATSVTPRCQAQLDDTGKYTVALDTQTTVFNRIAGNSEYIATCTVSQTPAQTPPGSVQITLEFSGNAPVITNATDLENQLTAATFRLDFPGRMSIFVEQDVTAAFSVDGLDGGVMKGSASFTVEKVTQYMDSSSDPNCNTADLMGVCYVAVAEHHAISFTTTLPTKQ